jgi:hypothetical protein
MKVFCESEVKSTKFEIRLSMRIRGKRRITNPVKVKANDLTKKEFNFLCKLIEKFNK